MSRLSKIILYPILFLATFILFLYWMFPYEVLKDRATSAIEAQLGSGIEVDIKTLSPYWFSGIDVRGLSIRRGGQAEAAPLLAVSRVHARAGLLSLLVGSPSVSFVVELGKGEIAGTADLSDEAVAVAVAFDDLDLSAFRFIAASIGLNLSSRIDGEVSLRVDRQRAIRSVGRVALDLVDLKIAPSEVKIAGMGMPLPDLVLAKGRESQIRLEVGKGTISFETMRLTGGDLGLDLKGKIFLSSKVDNYRFNLNGTFTVSPKLSEALPFLFIIEQQKQEDGSYPLTVTGRLEKPSIKVGTFTVPL